MRLAARAHRLGHRAQRLSVFGQRILHARRYFWKHFASDDAVRLQFAQLPGQDALTDSTDGHLNGFRKSTQFRAFFPPIRPYIKDIEEMQMQHYAVVEGLDSDPSAASRRST